MENTLNEFINKLLDDIHNINPELSLKRQTEYNQNFVNKVLNEQLRIAGVMQAEPEKVFNIPDVRNKLSPFCHIIALIEDGEVVPMDALTPAKKAINYLCDRREYDV